MNNAIVIAAGDIQNWLMVAGGIALLLIILFAVAIIKKYDWLPECYYASDFN